MPKAEKDPRVLAYEKPVRFGRSLLAKGTERYESSVADGDKLHELLGSLIEPREVYSLNVMSFKNIKISI